MSEFAIGLRSAFLSQHFIKLCAGAGIVADSTPQQEWEEMEEKFNIFSNIIG